MRATSLVGCNTPRMKTSYRLTGQSVRVGVNNSCPRGPGQRLLAGDGVDGTMVRSAAGPHSLEIPQ